MSNEKVELKSPRKPLEPVKKDDPRFDAAMKEYEQLLDEWSRVNEIKHHRVEGVSFWIEKPDRTYTVAEYDKRLAAYKANRAEYNKRFDGCLETIEMVRAKIRRLEEEDEKLSAEEAEEPEEEVSDPPAAIEEIPDEPFDQWNQRMQKYLEDLRSWQEKTMAITGESMKKSQRSSDRLLARLEETGKFPQLDYELEMRLRHTYINPETGEPEYRPNDEVGEGLICLGSRDYTPTMED